MASQAPASENILVPPTEINRSCCLPVTLLLASSVKWLIIAGVLGLLSSIKLHSGGFLAGVSWLSYGRVYPAYLNVLVFGFAAQAGLGIGLWILSRLSRNIFFGPLATTIAVLFWNLGVVIGVLGILAGDNTGYQWLEIPRYASPILFLSYSVIALCAVITFHNRREPELYVSQWYLLTALFWFPWIYSTAQLLVIYFPERGIVQAITAGWFAHNLFAIWLTSLALATIFYFLPKILGRPLHSHYLAMFGFWTLIFFGCWGGIAPGAPMPTWLSSLSIAAAGLTLIPVLAVLVNWHVTLRGPSQKLAPNPILPFLKFSAFCFASGSLLGILSLLHSPTDLAANPHDMTDRMLGTFTLVFSLVSQINALTQFTYFGNGLTALFLYGFFGMAMTAGIYYIVPRLTQCEWPSQKLIQFNFFAASVGVVLLVIPLMIGGIRQGAAMNDPNIGFLEIVRGSLPFLGTSTLGMLLLLAGNTALGINLARLLLNCRCFECCPSAASTANRPVPASIGASL